MKDHETIRKEILSQVKKVVLKLGSSVVTTDEGLDFNAIQEIVEDVVHYRKLGKEFIIVSSGAIAAGVRRIGLSDGPKTIPQKQAAASIGQTGLMATYETAFSKHDIQVGQILLTRDDLTHRRRYLNARNTVTTLLSWGVVPIVNENDTVMVAEIELGDNDNLSALVSAVAEADLLLILTDTEGVMDCDPTTNSDACLIPCIEEITDDIRSVACGTSSGVGRGGMSSKIEAAEKAAKYGVPTIITRGKQPNIVKRVLEGEQCGTLVLPAKTKMSARKHWIRYNLVPEGTLTVDDGAARAMIQRRTSLLPVGVTAVEGSFEHGAAVTVKDLTGNMVAVGLVNYSSEELKKIVGHQTSEIEWILGYRRNDDAIHADNLVLWAGENGK